MKKYIYVIFCSLDWSRTRVAINSKLWGDRLAIPAIADHSVLWIYIGNFRYNLGHTDFQPGITERVHDKLHYSAHENPVRDWNKILKYIANQSI